MKKVLKYKVYDTDTAKLIGQRQHNDGSSVSLYQKKTGHYFTYVKSVTGAEKITPIDLEEAKKVGKELLSAEEYNKHFGDNLTADDEEITASFKVKASTHIRIKQIAVEENCTIAELLERFVINYYNNNNCK